MWRRGTRYKNTVYFAPPLFTCDYICDTCTDSPCRLHSYPLNIGSSRSAAVWWGDLVLELVSLLQEKSISLSLSHTTKQELNHQHPRAWQKRQNEPLKELSHPADSRSEKGPWCCHSPGRKCLHTLRQQEIFGTVNYKGGLHRTNGKASV